MPAPDDTQTGAADLHKNVLVFHPGNCMPSVKALTFYRSGTFTLDVHYIDDSEPPNISTYMVACCAFFPVTITYASLTLHMTFSCTGLCRSDLSSPQMVKGQS